MTTRRVHFSLDISGALKRPKDWVNCITVDGKTFATAEEVTSFLKEQLALGRRLLPLADDCEGFDYQTGCPGHEISDTE